MWFRRETTYNYAKRLYDNLRLLQQIFQLCQEKLNVRLNLRCCRIASPGLRVPKAIGDFIMLDILRKSNETAVAVSDEELIEDAREIGASEGIFAAPEGGALVSALKKLLETGEINRDERVVLFNTGSGIKYLEAFEAV